LAPKDEATSELGLKKLQYLLAYRNITNATNERTIVMSVLPIACPDFSLRILFPNVSNKLLIACLIGNTNSIILDYLARQKLGGTNLSDYVTKQLAILPPVVYDHNTIEFIVGKVVELIYTAWDTKQFADDVWKDADESLKTLIRKQWEDNKQVTGGHEWAPPAWAEIDPNGISLPPFKWDENRRAQLRAELDAYYAILYGLTEEELHYILDPQDVYGPDFPGETFRVLKNKELKQFGTYRTKNLILQSFHSLTLSGENENGK